MKLRNKKTGEIRELPDGFFCGDNLKKICEEWEDYKEPKKHYFTIDDDGVLICRTAGDFLNEGLCKQIGNYFETEEEAKKAVKKLEAWKRLRDKGFRFKTWYGGSKNIDWEITSLENETYIPRQICDDLDLLFGGEE